MAADGETIEVQFFEDRPPLTIYSSKPPATANAGYGEAPASEVMIWFRETGPESGLPDAPEGG